MFNFYLHPQMRATMQDCVAKQVRTRFRVPNNSTYLFSRKIQACAVIFCNLSGLCFVFFSPYWTYWFINSLCAHQILCANYFLTFTPCVFVRSCAVIRYPRLLTNQRGGIHKRHRLIYTIFLTPFPLNRLIYY